MRFIAASPIRSPLDFFLTYRDVPCMFSILLPLCAIVPYISIRLLFNLVPQGSCFHPPFLHSYYESSLQIVHSIVLSFECNRI
jgi:hypothetical protein